MINLTFSLKYCKLEDISKIENYEQALADKIKVWDLHHRLEIQGDKTVSRKELIKQDLYFNRPPEELIFMTRNDHIRLHNSTRKLSKETRKKISKSCKGREFSKEHKINLSESHKKYWENWRKRKGI